MENIEKNMFGKVSESALTKILFAYTTEDSSKHIHQVLISESWDRVGRWTGRFTFHVTTDKYSTIYSDMELAYFSTIYGQLKEDGVDTIVLNTLEEIVRAYLPEDALMGEEGIEEEYEEEQPEKPINE